MDILPELPSSLRRLINMINKDSLDLKKNLEQLNQIEQKIKRNSKNNFYFFSLLFILIPPFTFLILGQVINTFDTYPEYLIIYVITSLLMMFIFRPKG